MKGDVKRHSSSFDWKSFDVQPLTTGVGSERSVAGKRSHRISRYNVDRSSEAYKAAGRHACQPWFYRRLQAYSFMWLCEGA